MIIDILGTAEVGSLTASTVNNSQLVRCTTITSTGAVVTLVNKIGSLIDLGSVRFDSTNGLVRPTVSNPIDFTTVGLVGGDVVTITDGADVRTYQIQIQVPGDSNRIQQTALFVDQISGAIDNFGTFTSGFPGTAGEETFINSGTIFLEGNKTIFLSKKPDGTISSNGGEVSLSEVALRL